MLQGRRQRLSHALLLLLLLKDSAVTPSLLKEETSADGKRTSTFLPAPDPIPVYLTEKQVASSKGGIVSPDRCSQHSVETFCHNFKPSLRRDQPPKGAWECF
mmetsp:Transcript_2631/g.4685  ORF Transcript_2631/g.4685 Transcript_2631/m.4685 type:complete len:102 (-) Transcript_2631:213-518(-)